MPSYRKLAAILAADVVGYSRLMSDDEQATVSTLQAYRQIFIQRVADHGGRVVDFPGDPLLAEFPSALEAVQCASEIQAQILKRNAQLADHRKMLFRIGINLGDVIQEEGALYGDGVNIAARLESLCAEGGICISGSVFDQVEGKLPFVFSSMGEQQVKNIPKPVRAYMVRPERANHASTSKTASRGNGKWRSRAIFAITSLLIVCALAFLALREHFSGRQRESDLVLAILKGPSIAVLPFSNFSGDPKQEALADGLSEDIITALSRFPDLFVIARNSTFKYKGKTEDNAASARIWGRYTCWKVASRAVAEGFALQRN